MEGRAEIAPEGDVSSAAARAAPPDRLVGVSAAGNATLDPAASPGLVADSAFFAPLREETRFYLVRHGQSEGNARRIIQGRRDFRLDEAGRAQAAAAGTWLASQKIGAVVTSPLARAAETGRIIAAACGLPRPRLDPTLMEIDTGMFSGISLDEARTRFPEAYAAFEHQSWDGVPDAEKSDSLFERAMSAWDLLRGLALDGERSIACVSHGGFIQWLVRATFGGRKWMPLLPTSNCGVFELLVTPTMAGYPAYMQWRLLNYQPAAGLSSLPPVF
ncbi:MAG TPA: histidine phosphatase family protein [Rectinemataceae bacterium]|nr:histidine phosphatase family protein [Rectinemataceae bacterium]